MTRTTEKTRRIPAAGAVGFTASPALARDLQLVLADLVELHLQAKQAHWNVVGPGFRSLHLELDDITAAAREASDLVAERLRALHGVPDGRSGTVAATTTLAAFPGGERSTAEVIEAITNRLHGVASTIRVVRGSVDAEDPVTTDLLHTVVETLEKHAWMLGVAGREPRR
ncbi:Dps family protein [Amycolatopsis thermoflava]|uniref:Starvation-inducible DNA-binding protein n=1 Tax=Amycolatopsis thermoflava TaxID=84480 RepID=A0A3N2GPW5_9PSEU|nr:DNA starvation/stationary phase protection protein [Amycolatopsis thermoflava]ROS38657.1 starvation-inducible DNA-binding protein [Amycolatopsis thermoflava]